MPKRGPSSGGSVRGPVSTEIGSPASDDQGDHAAGVAGDGAGASRDVPARSRPWAIRLLVGAGVVVAGLISATVFSVTTLSGSAPSWWRPVRADDPATRDAAVAVENALGTELHRVRGTEPWQVALRAEDATAWLNTRLNGWLVSQGQRDRVFRLPDGMDELQVQFEGDRVYLGVRLLDTGGGRARFLSAALAPRLDADGRLWLPAEWVHVGRLPIPASWALSRADEEREVLLPEGWRESDEADVFFAVLAGEIPVPQPARLELADGRVVRAMEVGTRDSRLTITFVTE